MSAKIHLHPSYWLAKKRQFERQYPSELTFMDVVENVSKPQSYVVTFPCSPLKMYLNDYRDA
jgi:hypothetical protein